MPSPALPLRRWFTYLLIALVFAAGTWYFGFRSSPGNRRKPYSSFRSGSQPVPVRAVPAVRHDLAVHLKAIGTVVPLNTVTVRSRVEGQLMRLAFEEGQQVRKGQLLAEIDPEQYRIRLAQMEGQQRENIANLQTAKSDLARFRQLNTQSLVSQQQLEQQVALVAQREGALAADQAQIDNARLQLAYTKIEAPISGRLGLRKVDVGNMVRASDSAGLVVITQTQPIAVMFTVPEIDLAKVVEPLRAGEKMAVEAWDRTEQTRLATGLLTTVDNQIDLATGTLRLKAQFPNDDEKLFPNQFVNVQLRVRTLKDVLVIPGAAVQYGSRGTYVFVVDEKSQAAVRDIVLGPADGPLQSIVKGLQPGDLAILEGLDQLREGRAVLIVKDGPPAKTDPTAALKKSAPAASKKSPGSTE